jgi:hypothetical protein
MSDVASSPEDRRAAARPPGVAALLVVLGTAGLLAGCQGFFHAQTGGIMSSYAEQHMLPYTMASADLGMACEMGVSMGAFLMSFERVTAPPRRAAIVTLVSAGMCAEAEAWEAELRQLRAVRDGRAAEAQDARIAEQRSHGQAATRFSAAWTQLESAFGRTGEGCPELDDDDELLYLLGLSAGMLAVLHDRAAGGLAQVPMDIPLRVSRAAACLDGSRWWGAPLALQAAVWALVPGALPESRDAWASLREAAELGDSQRVRLARAFQIQILDASGRDAELREALAAHAASTERTPSDPDWRLLDAYASRMILHVSDRLWTTERGHRTPLGAFGTFPQSAAPTAEDDALFDDLLLDTFEPTRPHELPEPDPSPTEEEDP